MNILERILQTKREEVAAARRDKPFEAIRAEAQAVQRPVCSFSEALRTSSNGIIAEFKRRSPSRGWFVPPDATAAKPPEDTTAVVAGYARSGAAAVSVLTDRDYFGGSLDDLTAARSVTGLPLLRKDFIVDPYQLCQARIAGADAVLLIAAAMTPDTCAELAAFAHSLHLEVLLEIHDESELAHIGPDVAPVVDVAGVNNRNLSTFATDVAVSFRLAPLLPGQIVRISESGISSPDTLRSLRQAGYRGFLMGENFMKRPDPAFALKQFIETL
jgi:indole-3-glycerol phosphate synthase